MLAADVVAGSTEGSWNTTESSQEGYEGIFAKVLYQRKSNTAPLRFAWPLPPGESIPFYAAFSSRWTAKLRGKDKQRAEPWTSSPANSTSWRATSSMWWFYLWGGSRTLVIEAASPDWATLARLVSNLGTRRAGGWSTWATGRAAAPRRAGAWATRKERQRMAERADGARSDRPAWRPSIEALQAERRVPVQAAGELKVERVLADTRQGVPEHAWGRTVERRSALVRSNQGLDDLHLPGILLQSSLRLPCLRSKSMPSRLTSLGEEKLQKLSDALASYGRAHRSASRALAENFGVLLPRYLRYAEVVEAGNLVGRQIHSAQASRNRLPAAQTCAD